MEKVERSSNSESSFSTSSKGYRWLRLRLGDLLLLELIALGTTIRIRIRRALSGLRHSAHQGRGCLSRLGSSSTATAAKNTSPDNGLDYLLLFSRFRFRFLLSKGLLGGHDWDLVIAPECCDLVHMSSVLSLNSQVLGQVFRFLSQNNITLFNLLDAVLSLLID